MNANAIVDKLLETDFDPGEVEATAQAIQPRQRWWIVPALFVVRAPTKEDADSLASDMQYKANHTGRTILAQQGLHGTLWQDEGLPTTEIQEQPDEDFFNEAPKTMMGRIPELA